ncbi:DUF2911 domain-containing protein [Roseivirga sp. 4D4]|uniref:DUF2911 domain-containing protein n=1 Tax=Roseivirga sp. 4D4 TaxID=1889784 RepID=UPI000A52CE7D|nr:DUF2911 domain-containing protein [Roseivirga sp. 4D4]
MVKKLFLLLILFFSINATYAQEAKPVKERLENLISYSSISILPDTLKNWIEWVETGESGEEEIPKRNKAWENFLTSYYRHLGTMDSPSMSEATLRGLSQYLTFPFLKGRILDFKSIGKSDISSTDVLSTFGNGSKHLLLIPELGFDKSLFDDFRQLYKSGFTFHEVSFPSGNNTLKYPSRSEYSKAVWLSSIESLILDYLNKLGNKELTVVAIGSGTQLAIKVASKSNKVKGIVSINGRYQSSLIDPLTGKDATAARRKVLSKTAFPTSMVIQVSPSNLSSSYAFSKDLVKNQQYLNQITPDNVNTIFRYSREFAAQDVIDEIRQIDIPILNIVPVHNDQSSKASDLATLRSWQELNSNHPDLPISIVRVWESQDLVFTDQPQLFDYYFSQFINQPRKPISQIPSENKVNVEPASPFASISQTIETTLIRIDYHQPAVNGRKVFGELVPFGQIWRAGANNATTIEVTNDVVLNEKFKLEKGRYSVFLIPKKGTWEVVFNHIADQWGAFNYKKSFDALRFKVTPETTKDMQEYLSYQINRTAIDKVEVSMHWENSRISFTINENFDLPKAPEGFDHSMWTKILDDELGDGVNARLTDGKSLSYFQKTDTLWLRYDLHAYNNRKAFALNLLIDSDNDQSTGNAWFGQNTEFTFDKALTLWMQKSSNGFQGINGIMNPEDFTTGNQNLAYMNNLTYYLSMEDKYYIVGVPIKDLELKSKKIRVIGAVGEFQTWNDDIGDSQSALISIKR